MENSISDSISIWVSIAIAAIILTVMSTMTSMQRQFALAQQQEMDAVAVVKEYRKWSPYDNTVVSSQDVATLVMKEKGDVQVIVTRSDGSFRLIWTGNTPAHQFTANFVSGVLPLSQKYTASLVEDANGSVYRVMFKPK